MFTIHFLRTFAKSLWKNHLFFINKSFVEFLKLSSKVVHSKYTKIKLLFAVIIIVCNNYFFLRKIFSSLFKNTLKKSFCVCTDGFFQLFAGNINDFLCGMKFAIFDIQSKLVLSSLWLKKRFYFLLISKTFTFQRLCSTSLTKTPQCYFAPSKIKKNFKMNLFFA